MWPSISKTTQRPINTAYPEKLNFLGDHIRKQRLDLGLMQKDVAEILQVKKATIWNWENNRAEPDILHYPFIMDFLGYCLYENPTTWGEKLRLFRIHKGLSYKMLAKILSVDPASIRRWEERAKPPWQKLRIKAEDYFQFSSSKVY